MAMSPVTQTRLPQMFYTGLPKEALQSDHERVMNVDNVKYDRCSLDDTFKSHFLLLIAEPRFKGRRTTGV